MRRRISNVFYINPSLFILIKKLIIIALLLSNTVAYSQIKINRALKKQLDSVMVLDQKYRDTLTLLMNPKTADSLIAHLSIKPSQATNYYWLKQSRLDSLNVIFIENIFQKYGYPGKSLVDTPANESAWYIIQHSKKIRQYLPLMKKAALNHELPFYLYAMMVARDLMHSNKEQEYGSQGACKPLKSGENIGCFIWPVRDVEHVNKRRKQAGFKLSVEQNAARLGITYTIIKINQVD